MIWIGLLVGYMIGAYLMRRHMLREMNKHAREAVARAARAYEATLVRRICDTYEPRQEIS